MSVFQGTALRLTDADVNVGARMVGIGVAELRSVMSVESRNSGYDGKNRPLILFEPHVFDRVLHKLAPDLVEKARAAGISYPEWGEKPYPKSSDGNYARLEAAIAIHEEAAYRAVSIGLGQILGENYKAAGFQSAKEMFESAMESEGNQLDFMLDFVKSEGLVRYLNAHDWAGFAARYNGKKYRKNHYDTLLAEHYVEWKKKLAANDNAPRDEATPEPSSIDVKAAQVRLNELGFRCGKSDGAFGPLTRSALRDFQDQHGLPTTGALDARTKELLGSALASSREVSDDRASGIPDGSRIIKYARYGKKAVGVGAAVITGSAASDGGTTTPAPAPVSVPSVAPPSVPTKTLADHASDAIANADATLSQMESAKSYWTRVHDLLGDPLSNLAHFAAHNPGLAIGFGLMAAGFICFALIEWARTDDHRTLKTV